MQCPVENFFTSNKQYKARTVLQLGVFLSLVLYSFNSFAQAPAQFNFQGVARNVKGAVIVAKPIALRFSIRTDIANGFFGASGGYTMMIKPYSDKTANGLTRCIIDFLTFKGHYANRINTQGQVRVHDIKRFDIFTQELRTVAQKVQFTKSSTRKGTPDKDAIINGRPVKIEVKIGKDTMSPAQNKKRAKIKKAGGLYYVARDMESFIEWCEMINKVWLLPGVFAIPALYRLMYPILMSA